MVRTILLLIMWLPTAVLGHVLSSWFFREGSVASYVFFLSWLPLNGFLAYVLCRKDDVILVIRLASFFLTQTALLFVVLTCAG